MSDVLDPATAEVQAVAARQRLRDTVVRLQARLSPKSLAQEAAQGIVAKGKDIAQGTADTARKHPVATVGAATAIGLLLARRPLARLFTHRQDATPAPPASLTTRAPRARPARKSE